MKRIDKVKQYVFDVLSKNSSFDNFSQNNSSVTADMVAQACDILRNDASRDLNFLVREGVLEKTSTYPVYFYIPKNISATIIDRIILNISASKPQYNAYLIFLIPTDPKYTEIT